MLPEIYDPQVSAGSRGGREQETPAKGLLTTHECCLGRIVAKLEVLDRCGTHGFTSQVAPAAGTCYDLGKPGQRGLTPGVGMLHNCVRVRVLEPDLEKVS